MKQGSGSRQGARGGGSREEAEGVGREQGKKERGTKRMEDTAGRGKGDRVVKPRGNDQEIADTVR
jgi:hypothetical protein